MKNMKNHSCGCVLCTKECKCAPYAELFSVLGNSNRQHIITALRQASRNVGEICELTGLEQTCVSHCLRLLEKHGFVIRRAEGKYRVYTLTRRAGPLLKALDRFMEGK